MPQTANKDGFFRCDDPIQPRNRRLKQARFLPLFNQYIHLPGSYLAGHTANDGILNQIEKKKRWAYFEANAVRKRETTKVYLAEHLYRAGASES